MIPWLLVAELISVSGKSLKQLVAAQQAAFPVSGEINRVVADPDKVIAAVEEKYLKVATHMDQVDGLSLEYPDWRFNLRKSITEPILRLNVEARGDSRLMESRTAELLALIDEVGMPTQAAHA
jgi:phosphomannomutase